MSDCVPSPPPSPCLYPAQEMNDSLDPLITINLHDQAWQLLIDRAVPKDELPSLIESLFLDRKAADMASGFRGNDAQAYIDVIGEVR